MTSQAVDTLFRPFRLKSLELKNRIVMAPMTRSMAPNGIPGAANAAYYRRRAEGGVGLILSEGTVIDRPAARNDPGIPFFHGEEALAGWQTVIDEVHAAGGKMAPQIWHVGSVKSFLTEWEPASGIESPSGLVAPGTLRGDAMSEEEKQALIAAYAESGPSADSVTETRGNPGLVLGYRADRLVEIMPAKNQRPLVIDGKDILSLSGLESLALLERLNGGPGRYSGTEAAFDNLAISANGFCVTDPAAEVRVLDDSDERFAGRTVTLRLEPCRARG